MNTRSFKMEEGEDEPGKVRTTIVVPEDVRVMGQRRAREVHRNFSSYITYLIERDVLENGGKLERMPAPAGEYAPAGGAAAGGEEERGVG